MPSANVHTMTTHTRTIDHAFTLTLVLFILVRLIYFATY